MIKILLVLSYKPIICLEWCDWVQYSLYFLISLLFVKSGALGYDLLECVYEHLDVVETDYFGLQFNDETGVTRWIHNSKSIKKQTSKQKGRVAYQFISKS